LSFSIAKIWVLRQLYRRLELQAQKLLTLPCCGGWDGVLSVQEQSLIESGCEPSRPGESARSQFPIFSPSAAELSGKPLAFLDTAASSQKPKVVIDALQQFYSYQHANIHRGTYRLSTAATAQFEAARHQVENLLGAGEDTIVLTRGTTESINLVARSLESWFQPGDTILLSVLEHHSNLVPWQLLAKRRSLKLEFVDCDAVGWVTVDAVAAAVKKHSPKLVSITQLANVNGAAINSQEICAVCKEAGAVVLLDGAQSVPHLPIDVMTLNCDFLAFSGHKMYGPTGIGGLYIHPRMLEHMEPFLGGGDMIESVSLAESTWAEGIQKFEAGTPAIAEAIGLGVAAEFLQSVGMRTVAEHDDQIFEYAWDRLRAIDGVEVYGPANASLPQRSIITFNITGLHPFDVATFLDTFNVQVRAGHHCAMPLLARLGLSATVRASFGIYTVKEDIDQLVDAVQFAKSVLL
jgi:cysteine desulfurase / selenocysteine lyase